MLMDLLREVLAAVIRVVANFAVEQLTKKSIYSSTKSARHKNNSDNSLQFSGKVGRGSHM